MRKVAKPEYSAEFRELAVKRVKEGLIPGVAQGYPTLKFRFPRLADDSARCFTP